MYINGKWYTESEILAYVKELEQQLHDTQKLLFNVLYVSFSENKPSADFCKKIGEL